MNQSYIYIISAAIGLWVLTMLAVQLARALSKRHTAIDYNKFIELLYTDLDKETPAIIGRIQYRYIIAYNDYLHEHWMIRLFFKPLEIRGEKTHLLQ